MLALFLSSCSVLDSPSYKTFSHMFPSFGGKPVFGKFDPNYRYIEIKFRGQVSIMASSNPYSDPEQTWLSPASEVLVMQDGRLKQTAGLGVEWRHVVIPKLPAWSVLAKSDEPFEWTRIRDVMPGYRYGVRDRLLLQKMQAPGKSDYDGDPEKLVWFKERDLSKNPLPPATYAYDPAKSRIVYGEQCLSRDFCFSWQERQGGR